MRALNRSILLHVLHHLRPCHLRLHLTYNQGLKQLQANGTRTGFPRITCRRYQRLIRMWVMLRQARILAQVCGEELAILGYLLGRHCFAQYRDSPQGRIRPQIVCLTSATIFPQEDQLQLNLEREAKSLHFRLLGKLGLSSILISSISVSLTLALLEYSRIDLVDRCVDANCTRTNYSSTADRSSSSAHS